MVTTTVRVVVEVLVLVLVRDPGWGVGSSIDGVGRFKKGVGWSPRLGATFGSGSPEGRVISRIEEVGSNSIQPIPGK